MKRIVIFIVILFSGHFLTAQYHFSFSHFTSDNGLSQNSITAMMKDKKGYMWLGTRDGLNKYDGYNITSFNGRFDKQTMMLNKRIIAMKEDKWGYIWVKTYDEIVYRFDPSTEQVIRISLSSGNYINDKIDEIIMVASGQIWLTTSDNGCYRIDTNNETHKITVAHLDKASKVLPHNCVKSVFQDKEQNTWILTNGGLVCVDQRSMSTLYFAQQPFSSYVENANRIIFGGKGKIYQYEKRNKVFKAKAIPVNAVVTGIVSLSPNNYLLMAKDHGFLSYDILAEEMKLYTKEKYPEMKTNDILQIYIDKGGVAWMAIKFPGVLRFNPQTNTIAYLPSTINEGQVTNPNYLIFEDEKDILWIQPYYGSFSWFDRKSNKLIPFYSAYNVDINTLFSYGVNHVISDSQGVMWISTNRGNGFFKCTFLPEYFNHYLLQDHSVYSIANETRSIFEDNERRLWVGCKDGEIHVYDESRRHLGTLGRNGTIAPGNKMGMLVYNMMQDKSGSIWLATKQQGLYRLKPKGGKNSFQLENFVHDPTDIYSPAANDFYSIAQDRKGRIWAGSYGGGVHLIEEQDGKIRFIHANNELKQYPLTHCAKVRQVYADSKNRIWVATTEGFLSFSDSFNSPKEIKFKRFFKNGKGNNGLGANDVHCIFEDTESNLWFGTFGGGLNRLKSVNLEANKYEFDLFDRAKGMPNNVIYTILDDRQGNLWLTTENAIVKFNKKSSKIEVFGKGNELENVEFSEASARLLHSGEICVGSKSGFYTFHPNAVKRRVINAPLVFTGLQLFNKAVEIGGEEGLLTKQIDETKQIEFNHKQNVFTIEFATLDMRAPEKIQYAYKLEGFDQDWNFVHTHFATYTALSPGTYKFRVKSTDSEGVWLDNERTIEVKILPSFWQSNFAKFLYFLLVVLIFFIALYVSTTIFKLKHNVLIEKQMTDMKLRFFTDISHELRTPLTLISLPVDNILKEELPANLKEQLLLVRRNLDRVMGLINQILDFRKVQNNKMRLSVEEIIFGEFVYNCAHNFSEIAHDKNINFVITDETAGAKIWADPNQLESIITNLLSNAFKFTPADKSITVKSWVTLNGNIRLDVIDQGVGIAQEKINFIFDRFFSVTSIRNFTQKSTGIGLDLVKKLVELHHATIQVESQLGKGSSFEIEFKSGLSHFDESVDIVTADQVAVATKPEPIPMYENENTETENNIPLILIVEDNDELRHFLKSNLKNNYRVEEAENGESGWHKIEHLMPDLVITDLKMPEMDGIQLIDKIKKDSRISHIPIILLSAVTDVESKVAGMKAGADDYITKPFSSEYLHARIENLMLQRQQLQAFYRSQIIASPTVFSLPPLETPSQEDQFMQHLIHIMDENLDNFDLNIDFLASEIGMSRTVFFNKLKSLTGFSPVEFVREIRFERAAEYIRNTQLSVSEVSYKVGIEDPRYFSRCFKQKFGATPSEYRHQQSKPGNS